MSKHIHSQGGRSTKHTDIQQEHHRVAPRLKGVVKNVGIKPKKKMPKGKG